MQQISAAVIARIVQCGASRNMTPVRLDTPRDDENELAYSLAIYRIRGGAVRPGERLNNQIITDEISFHVHQFVAALLPTGIADQELQFPMMEANALITAKPHYFVLDNGTLYIDQFEYGWGLVEPETNWEMIAAMLAIRAQYVHLWPSVQRVNFRVHQPRPYHRKGRIREHIIDGAEAWAETYHKMLVRALVERANQLRTGDECYKCPSHVACPAARAAGLNAVDVTFERHEDELPPEETGVELKLLYRAQKMLKARIDALEDSAYHHIKGGRAVPGFLLEPTKGNRKWKDHVTPELLQMMTGVEPKKAMPSPAELERQNVNESVIAMLSHRPIGGLKLVQGDPTERLK